MKKWSLLLQEIVQAQACTQPFVVGVNGLDCSGKTYTSGRLQKALMAEGLKVKLLHIDDFNNLNKQRRIYERYVAGCFNQDDFNDYYTNSIHYDDFRQAVINERSDCDVLIAEGVFLFKDSLIQLFDYKVFIEVDFDVARSRYQSRKLEVGDTRPFTVFDDLWLKSFVKYCAECKPEAKSDFILPN